METLVNITYGCVLPPPGAPEEPMWLQNFRRMGPSDTPDWSDELDDEIAQVKTFQFRLESVYLNLGQTSFGDSLGSDHIADPKAFLFVIISCLPVFIIHLSVLAVFRTTAVYK
jgi:hypothetical protein